MELIEFYGAGTIAIIGIIEWLKQLEIKNFKKFTPYVSLILCIVAGFFAAKSNAKLDAWNIFCYCGGLLACVQLGYQAVVEAICGAINRYLNKNNNEVKVD
jgi:hypothetical protein